MASTPEPTTFSAAISRWRPSSTGSSASGRASGHAHELPRAGVERDVRARALERAQLGDRLLGDDAPRGGADRPSELVMVSTPGRPFIRPTRTRVLELAGGLGGEQQRQAALDRGLDRLAEVHHRARAWRVRRSSTAPSRAAALNSRAGNVRTRSASSAIVVPSGARVGCGG